MTATPRGSRRRLLALGVAVAIFATFLGYRYGSSDPAGSRDQRAERVVKVRTTTRYGRILVTSGGFTLYIYKEDEKDRSECYAFCLQMWPPMTVANGVRPEGIGVSDLGFIVRSNGEHQVTYKGMPLYHYVLDHYPGRVRGDSGWWSVVNIGSAHTT